MSQHKKSGVTYLYKCACRQTLLYPKSWFCREQNMTIMETVASTALHCSPSFNVRNYFILHKYIQRCTQLVRYTPHWEMTHLQSWLAELAFVWSAFILTAVTKLSCCTLRQMRSNPWQLSLRRHNVTSPTNVVHSTNHMLVLVISHHMLVWPASNNYKRYIFLSKWIVCKRITLLLHILSIDLVW